MQELNMRAAALGLASGDDSSAEQISKIQAERDLIKMKVPEKYLALYTKIAGVRAGVGIAKLNESKCGGCNMALPPQFIMDIMRSILIEQCPHCKRILYPTFVDA